MTYQLFHTDRHPMVVVVVVVVVVVEGTRFPVCRICP